MTTNPRSSKLKAATALTVLPALALLMWVLAAGPASALPRCPLGWHWDPNAAECFPPPPPPVFNPQLGVSDVETPIVHCITPSICQIGGYQHNLVVTGTGWGRYTAVRLRVYDELTGAPQLDVTLNAGWWGGFSYEAGFGMCSSDGRFVSAQVVSTGYTVDAVVSPCAYL